MPQDNGGKSDLFAAMWEQAGPTSIYFPPESKDSQKLLTWLHHLVNSTATNLGGQMKTVCWKAQHCYQNTIYPNKIYMNVNL